MIVPIKTLKVDTLTIHVYNSLLARHGDSCL